LANHISVVGGKKAWAKVIITVREYFKCLKKFIVISSNKIPIIKGTFYKPYGSRIFFPKNYATKC